MNEIDRASKAKAVLESPAFAQGFDAVRAAIFARIESCSLTETQTAEDLRRCLKLLRDLRLNLEVAVNTGKLASFRLEEDEKRRANPLRGFFR